jgi:3-hydroxyacyl-[acyl-carrier-protein] dehydratase
MAPGFIVDVSRIDFEHPIADLEQIRQINPQRFEMEQLTAIVSLHPKEQTVVGFKDVGPDEFWVRGHMPNFPLMPGVLICEAAAQLCSYYVATQGLLGGVFIAFGGMTKIKFRGMVRPGDRLVLAARAKEVRPGRMAVFECQGFVDGSVVFQAEIIGAPFPRQPEWRPPGIPERVGRGRS